jgi:putative flippase GtrA
MRFLAVNGGCFVLDIALLLALHHLAHAPAGVAATIAFALASAVNFVLSRQWVFAQTARGGNPRADLARYVGLVFTGLLLTAVVVSVLAHLGLDYRLAKLAASGMVGILNFIVLPRWVFSGDRSASLTPDEAPEPAPATAGQ